MLVAMFPSVGTSWSMMKGTPLDYDVVISKELSLDRNAFFPKNVYDGDRDYLNVLPTDRIMVPSKEEWDNSPILVQEHKLILFAVPKVACTVWKQLFRKMKKQNVDTCVHSRNRSN